MRWAAFHWSDDPLSVAATNDYFPGGEEVLLYPNAQASVRWEVLRDSIENYRKIALLRREKAGAERLRTVLDGIDFESAKTDDEETFRAKVGAVHAVLDEGVDE